jgi:hypothetical protein
VGWRKRARVREGGGGGGGHKCGFGVRGSGDGGKMRKWKNTVVLFTSPEQIRTPPPTLLLLARTKRDALGPKHLRTLSCWAAREMENNIFSFVLFSSFQSEVFRVDGPKPSGTVRIQHVVTQLLQRIPENGTRPACPPRPSWPQAGRGGRRLCVCVCGGGCSNWLWGGKYYSHFESY